MIVQNTSILTSPFHTELSFTTQNAASFSHLLEIYI
jgi:hypothetical protein